MILWAIDFNIGTKCALLQCYSILTDIVFNFHLTWVRLSLEFLMASFWDESKSDGFPDPSDHGISYKLWGQHTVNLLPFKNLTIFSLLFSCLMPNNKIFHLTNKGLYIFIHLLWNLDHTSFWNLNILFTCLFFVLRSINIYKRSKGKGYDLPLRQGNRVHCSQIFWGGLKKLL